MASVGGHSRPSTTCWTTGSPTCKTNKALRLPSAATANCSPITCPYLGEHPVGSLGTLHLQQLYDWLARDGRWDGKAGGLGPRTIRQVHLCLHQALGYAMKWHDLPANPAADAEPPAIPPTPAALTPSRSAFCSPPPSRSGGCGCAFTVLAAATGARTGELCGLEWRDLDLEAATVRFPPGAVQHRPAACDRPAASRRQAWQAAGRRPPQTPASQAVLSLTTFAMDALRDYQHEQAIRAPLRLMFVQPGEAPRPVELDLLLRTERDCSCAAGARQPGVPRFRAGRRGPGASTPAAPLAGLGDGGGQGTGQRDRRAAAPRRRRHAGR